MTERMSTDDQIEAMLARRARAPMPPDLPAAVLHAVREARMERRRRRPSAVFLIAATLLIGGGVALAAIGGSNRPLPPPTSTDPFVRQPSSSPDASRPHLSAAQVLAVATTSYQTCVIRGDGALGCWGELTAIPPDGTFVALSASDTRACGIRTDGRPVCWPDVRGPVPEGRFTAISVGAQVCAIRSDAALLCWANEGDPEYPAPAPPSGAFSAVDVGQFGACAIRTDAKITCWGELPSAPSGAFAAVSVGDFGACGIRAEGTLECWGDAMPAELSGSGEAGSFVAVDVAGRICAITSDGSLACWVSPDDTEVQPPPDGTFTAIALGPYHGCAIRNDASVECWGNDEYGQVKPKPVAVIEVGALFVDGRYQGSMSVDVRWAASGLSADAAAYDVRYRQVPWNVLGGPDAAQAWRTATTETTGTMELDPGYMYEFEVRARLADGSTSAWRGTSTYAPLDDRSLTPSAGWSTVAASRYYAASATQTMTRGAKLTLDEAVGGAGIGLIASSCPTCGSVKVYRDADLLGEVDLSAPAPVDSSIFIVAIDYDEEYEGAGKITIEVTSTGELVTIDGLIVIQG